MSLEFLFLLFLLSFSITYVQSGPGVTTGTPQQSTVSSDAASPPSSITTLGFTAIAPAGQTLVQPIVGHPPFITPALPITCHSHTSPGQTAGTVARQVNTRTYVLSKTKKNTQTSTAPIFFFLPNIYYAYEINQDVYLNICWPFYLTGADCHLSDTSCYWSGLHDNCATCCNCPSTGYYQWIFSRWLNCGNSSA